MSNMPGLALPHVEGRRRDTLDLAKEAERRGFSTIVFGSFGDPIGMCLAVAQVTSRIRLGTTIQPIYWRSAFDLAQAASVIQELSGDRFFLGIGIAHEPTYETLGVKPGRPLSDMRTYVAELRAQEDRVGRLPPLVLAALRSKMTALAGQVADGVVWAEAPAPYVPKLLQGLPTARSPEFIVGDVIFTCVADNRREAEAAIRQALMVHLPLPNYRNFWREAGYVEEVDALDAAVAAGDLASLPGIPSTKMLMDTTLFGTKTDVREGVERFRDAGIILPLLVNVGLDGTLLDFNFSALFEAFA